MAQLKNRAAAKAPQEAKKAAKAAAKKKKHSGVLASPSAATLSRAGFFLFLFIMSLVVGFLYVREADSTSEATAGGGGCSVEEVLSEAAKLKRHQPHAHLELLETAAADMAAFTVRAPAEGERKRGGREGGEAEEERREKEKERERMLDGRNETHEEQKKRERTCAP